MFPLLSGRHFYPYEAQFILTVKGSERKHEKVKGHRLIAVETRRPHPSQKRALVAFNPFCQARARTATVPPFPPANSLPLLSSSQKKMPKNGSTSLFISKQSTSVCRLVEAHNTSEPFLFVCQRVADI